MTSCNMNSDLFTVVWPGPQWQSKRLFGEVCVRQTQECVNRMFLPVLWCGEKKKKSRRLSSATYSASVLFGVSVKRDMRARDSHATAAECWPSPQGACMLTLTSHLGSHRSSVSDHTKRTQKQQRLLKWDSRNVLWIFHEDNWWSLGLPARVFSVSTHMTKNKKK